MNDATAATGFYDLVFGLGKTCGYLYGADTYADLVSSLRTRDLNADYITLLRDRLTEALREAGIEPAPAP